MEDIDLIKTLQKNRLVYKTHWIESYEIFSLILSLSVMIFFSGMSFMNKNIQGVLSFGCFILLIAGLAIYKYSKSKKLIFIVTPFKKEVNKKLFEEYLIEKNFNIWFLNEDYSRSLSENNIWFNNIELTSIYQDNRIIINVISSTGFMRFPSELRFGKISRDLKMKYGQHITSLQAQGGDNRKPKIGNAYEHDC